MFIWLKDLMKDLLGEFTCETARAWIKNPDATTQWDQKRSQSYVSVTFHGGLMDPTTECPCIPVELVTHVTHREDVVGINCYRKEGVYKTADASIVVSSFFTSDNGETAQAYAIYAASVAAAKHIYCKVRRGELLPVEDWTAPQKGVVATKDERRQTWYLHFVEKRVGIPPKEKEVEYPLKATARDEALAEAKLVWVNFCNNLKDYPDTVSLSFPTLMCHIELLELIQEYPAHE
ncbi:MAG: hypothetical protein V1902_02630 [Candidatus Falkowbacteria bacterium]